MRYDVMSHKSEIEQWISEGLTLKEMSIRLHCSINAVKGNIKRWKISYRGAQGSNVKHFKERKSPSQILIVHPLKKKSGRLATALVESGREYKCEWCEISDIWNDKKLVLEVDHINGINFDHRPENLRFLCPNCHSQTTNRVVGKKRQELIAKFESELHNARVVKR